MSKVPWRSAAIASGAAVVAGYVALKVMLGHVDDMGPGEFYLFNIPFYMATWFAATMILWLGGWAATSMIRRLIARRPPTLLDLAFLLLAVPVAYLVATWSISAYRVFKVRTTSQPELIEAMYERHGTSERWLLKAMAGNPACPPELLTELAGLKNLDDVWQASLRDLIAGSMRSVRRLVTLNPSSPPKLLRELAREGAWPEILSNPSTPVDVLQEALSKGNLDTRRRIARGAAATEILESLSMDTDREVRRRVAANPKAPASTLERLVDAPSDIRLAVAQNPSTSQNTLETLSSDADPMVRDEALRRLGRSPGGNGNSQQ